MDAHTEASHLTTPDHHPRHEVMIHGVVGVMLQCVHSLGLGGAGRDEMPDYTSGGQVISITSSHHQS